MQVKNLGDARFWECYYMFANSVHDKRINSDRTILTLYLWNGLKHSDMIFFIRLIPMKRTTLRYDNNIKMRTMP